VELKEKKEHAIRCIQLGLDLYSSMIIAECTQLEMEKLEEDEKFNAEVLFTQKIQERDLLKQHSESSLIAALKGNTHGLEKQLEWLNPKRYGRAIKEEEFNDIPKVVVLVGKYADENEK